LLSSLFLVIGYGFCVAFGIKTGGEKKETKTTIKKIGFKSFHEMA